MTTSSGRDSEVGPGSSPRTGIPGQPLLAARAVGRALVLYEPLSFWGGVDPSTGVIIDRRHPQLGRTITDRILLMPSGRGSSSSSTVLAEALRLGAGPAGIVLRHPDPILVLGAIVARELYGIEMPVILSGEAFGAVRDGNLVEMEPSGQIHIQRG